MFLLYLLTTGVSCGVFYIKSKAYNEYLQRNHYVSTGSVKESYELDFEIMSYILKSLVPGYNICCAISILWKGSKQFEINAENALKKGTIRKLTDEEILKHEEEVNDYLARLSLNQDESEYEDSEMTYEEKLADLEFRRMELEREKEFLINSRCEEETKPIQFKLERK